MRSEVFQIGGMANQALLQSNWLLFWPIIKSTEVLSDGNKWEKDSSLANRFLRRFRADPSTQQRLKKKKSFLRRLLRVKALTFFYLRGYPGEIFLLLAYAM